MEGHGGGVRGHEHCRGHKGGTGDIEGTEDMEGVQRPQQGQGTQWGMQGTQGAGDGGLGCRALGGHRVHGRRRGQGRT